MVTRGAYYDEDEQNFRRYSSRGHGYPLSHDHDLPPAPHHAPYARTQHMSSQNIRQSPEQDNNAQPRRRIPVACGRCRKRKIRCSGDPGNGHPCSNCKSAGNDTCQFLRVSSTEAQMKSDGADFGYDSAAAVSRIHCRMSPYGPQHQPYTPHVTSLGPDGYPYRNNSLSAYQMPLKYYNIASYGDFADESVDYGIHTSTYPIMNQEPISIPYSAGNIRGWTQGPQVQKNNSLFVEQESSYNHGQLPFHSNTFPIRPTISPESKSVSLNGMSTSLPAPINGTDRVLPFPASNRSAPVGPSYLRSTETLLPMSQPPMQYSNHGLMSTSMMNAVKALNVSVASESASISSTYLPLSSSPDSIPSSQMSFGNHSVSTSSQNHDGYTPSHETSQHSLFQHNNSSNDMGSYGPSSSGSHRPSISSQNNGEDSQSQAGNSSAPLVNGYHYQPPPVSTQTSYQAPPMVSDTREMQSAAPVTIQPRRSVSAA